MARGIDKIKYVGGGIFIKMSVPNLRITVPPDRTIGFKVEWEAGATPADKTQPITWFVRSTDKRDYVSSDTLPSSQTFGFKIPKILCGSYHYFIDASLLGVPGANSKGIFVKGYCPPRIVKSKWSTINDGEDVRSSHQFFYGDRICLGLETEGLNGDFVTIDIFRRVRRGGGVDDDQHIAVYTMAKVIDGEINITLGNTYGWLGNIKKPSDVEEFYVKVKSTDGKYVTDGKDDLHARYLRIKNKISNTREQTSTSNTPVKIGDTEKSGERMSLAAVYFRPLNTWNGEFGFDWLREKDNGLAPSNDPAYADIIEGGYLDGISDLTGGATGTAYAKLKNQYQRLPVTNTGYAVTEYFAPYLTLFPKSFVDTLPATLLVKPKYEAGLKVLVAINGPIDRLEFEYDKNLLTVDKNILSDKTKTNSLVPSADTSIKITCKKDLTSDKDIKIYCYPKNNMPRILAGKIRVLRNDVSVRKKMDFVLIGVRTNIDGITDTTGSFGPQEIKNLYYSLHQAFIIPNVRETTLDLSTNIDFQIGGRHIETLRSRKNLIAYVNNTNHDYRNPALYTDARSLFFNDKDAAGNYKNTRYRTYFTVFKFGLESNNPDTLGAVEHIGIHNVIMFTLVPGDDCTLNHEILHGLGLNHTHRDDRTIKEAGYKYIFPCAIPTRFQPAANNRASTDNVMSYRMVTRSTWRWQWNVINPKILEK